MRKLLTAAAATVMLALAVAPAAAQTTSDVGVMAGPCGSSYGHVGHHPIRKTGGTEIVGYFDIYWSSTTKRNCLVVNGSGDSYGYLGLKQATIKFSDQGERYFDWPGAYDSAPYRYYAGPVYTMEGLNGTGRCVDVLGLIQYPGGEAVARHNNLHCG